VIDIFSSKNVVERHEKKGYPFEVKHFRDTCSMPREERVNRFYKSVLESGVFVHFFFIRDIRPNHY